MNRESQELIVWKFKNKTSLTYPELSDIDNHSIVFALIGDTTHPPLICIKTGTINELNNTQHLIFSSGKIISERIKSHPFSDQDVFRLTEYGENILYEAKNKKHSIDIAENSLQIAKDSLLIAEKDLKESHKSGMYAKRSYYAAIIIGVISISVSIIMAQLLD